MKNLFNVVGIELPQLKKYVEDILKKATDDSNEKANYVILMCRRWLIVFEMIHQIFFEGYDDNYILCDDDLYGLNSENNILITDDIIIHGRTVMQLYNDLIEKNHKVEISSFYKKYDAEFLNQTVFDYISGRNVTEWEWHDLSNKLINLILKCGIPYTTFTYSFLLEEGNICGDLDRFETISLTNKLFEENKIDVKMYFEKKCLFNIFSKLCCYACIREYKYFSGDLKVSYIPFVFIPEINIKVFDILGRNGGGVFPGSVIEVFKSEQRSAEYKSRLLSFLLSYAYGVVSLSIERINEQRMSIVKSIISKSFQTTFEDILSLTIEECKNILNFSWQEEEKTNNFEENDEIEDDFYNFPNNEFEINQTNDLPELILELFSALHKENEKRAKNKLLSSWGYKISGIIKNINSYSLFNVLAFLISMWDIGKGSYYFKRFGDIIYSCISDGEQAYRIDYQKYKPFARSVFRLAKYSKMGGDSEEELWKEYISYLKENKNIIGLPNDYLNKINESRIFFSDKAVTDINDMASLEKSEFEEKLYEGTVKFLRSKIAET